MLKRDENASNDKGGPRTRLGTKVVASIAAISLVASMCPGTAALAFANEQYAAGTAELQAQAKMETVVTKDTHEMKAGAYHVTENVTINPDASGNAVQVEKGAKVIIYIDKGTTLTVTGADAKGSGVGHAAILLPEGSVLTVDGEGTLNATGGRGGSGANGGAAEHSHVWAGSPSSTGRGGHGGAGGGGAGAGIGTDGGAGGAGGEGGERVNNQGLTGSNIYGHEGKPGSSGSVAEAAGTFIAKGEVTVNAKGGARGEKGGARGARGSYAEDGKKFGYNTSAGTSGGGGGGAVGSTTDGIGPGGAGGGGGGGGASGSFDGEFAFFIKGDLDDLWGHGGDGGKSAWGIGDGARGDEGANGGDDTNASKKYAKAGGAGGNGPQPTRAPFYFFKAPLSTSAGPRVNCSTTYGEDRHGTEMSNYNDFMKTGGLSYSHTVRGVTLVYDEETRGVRVVPNKLNTQSNSTGALSTQAGDSGMLRTQANSSKASEELPDSGTLEIDGYTVNYEIAYYDDAGKKLDSAPTLPGQYLAIASFTCADNDEYSGDLVEPINIAKREVAKPTPAELTFVCADWSTGEGKVQEAFPELNETDYEFVADAKAEDGAASLKAAKDAGEYMACFKLKDPETCQWAGESEDTQEIWVPWSIKLQEFDPNEVTYWGTAHDNTTTAVTYNGKPQWVRPFFTYAKGTDGKFPSWFTHWGSNDRPANDKNSAAVLYVQGEDDEQGLVGYHTNEDGTFEPVTGAQVYAWANGVDVDGRHVDLESGEKVWYRTGADGWWEPLAVQDEEPEGADGSVVARDWAYVDRLGVMEPGTYQAYALFDEGAGFAPTALVEATVEVRAADAAPTKPVPAKASSSPKTGDLSPLAIGGFALAALLGAGALALSLARRRA